MPSQIQQLSSHTTAKFKWKINDFSKLDKTHYSDVFSVGDWKWKLQINPKGDVNTINHLSLYLIRVDMTKSVFVDFSLTVTCQSDIKNNKTQKAKHQIPKGDYGWGWPEFMPLTQLHDSSKGYLKNNTCIIQVVVTCPTRDPDVVAATGQTSKADTVAATGQTSKGNPVAPTGKTNGGNQGAPTAQTSEASPVVVIVCEEGESLIIN